MAWSDLWQFWLSQKVLQEQIAERDEELYRLNQKCSRVPWDTLPDLAPPQTMLYADGYQWHREVAGLVRLPVSMVRLQDLFYTVPIGKAFWEQYTEWIWPWLSPQYDTPNRGSDCENLSRRFQEILGMLWPEYDTFSVGTTSVLTKPGDDNSGHGSNVVFWMDAATMTLCYGCVDMTPKHIFPRPPPMGVFDPVAFGWEITEVEI